MNEAVPDDPSDEPSHRDVSFLTRRLRQLATCAQDDGQIEVFDRPQTSDIRLERFDDGLSFHIPAPGVWKGSARLFVHGIICLVMSAGFTAVFAAAGHVQGAGILTSIVNSFLVMSLFWMAAAAMLYFGWKIGARETGVAVVGERVIALQTDFGHTKRREWSRSEVKTIQVGPSQISVNDEPVMELQILGEKRTLHAMLVGRDVRELHWMASLLRQALSSSGEPASFPQDCDQPGTET